MKTKKKQKNKKTKKHKTKKPKSKWLYFIDYIRISWRKKKRVSLAKAATARNNTAQQCNAVGILLRASCLLAAVSYTHLLRWGKYPRNRTPAQAPARGRWSSAPGAPGSRASGSPCASFVQQTRDDHKKKHTQTHTHKNRKTQNKNQAKKTRITNKNGKTKMHKTHKKNK